jgi:outer membrane protein TolC
MLRLNRLRPQMGGVPIGIVLACAVVAVAAEPVTNETIQKLARERLQIVSQLHELTLASYRSGTTSLSDVLQARADLLAARLDTCQTKAQRIEVLEAMVKLAEETKKLTEQLASAAEVSKLQVLKAEAHVLEARIRLEREKAAP